MAKGVESTTQESLVLRYDGGLADRGSLFLDEYAQSLEGWEQLFRLLGQLYFHTVPELRKFRSRDLLRIEVVAEEPGSFSAVLTFTLLAIAGGIIGNRADRAAVLTFAKLVEWWRDFISHFVREKAKTTDVTAIVQALLRMTEERGITLDEESTSEGEEPQLFDPEDVATHFAVRVNPSQAVTEKFDQLLKSATKPLDNSCLKLTIATSDQRPVLEIGPAERAVISAPLTLPPPKRNWVKAHVKFERINRKTGRALIYFQNDNPGRGAHYSRIVDEDVKKPHNPYTEAFNDDRPLEVWVRQAHAEKGNLNFQWELTTKSEGETLFDQPPPD